MTSALGVSSLAERPLAGTFVRAAPTVTITSPGGVLTTGTATLEFTYSSVIGRVQYSYQYQLRTPASGAILYDSSTVVSSSTTVEIPFVLAGGSSYEIWVRASDMFDTSDWVMAEFSCESSDVSAYSVNERVGSVYEIGINGIGLMLADDEEIRIQRQAQQLNPPRLVTSDTPFTESFDRYVFVGQADFSGGAGQKFREREDTLPTRFYRSEGVNVVDDGVRLGYSFEALTSTYTRPLLAVWQDGYLMAGGDGSVSYKTGAPWSITGAGTISDIATGGGHWYVCDGSNIYRNSSNADPGSAWSTINAESIEWCIDRLAAVYDDGAGYMCVTTFTDAGTEEVSGGRFKYEDTNEIPSMTAGGGYLWFIVNDGYSSSRIMFWQVGSTDTYAANALELPPGEKAVELFYYLGNVMVRAHRGQQVVIYRCVQADGRLTAELVLDFDEATADHDTRGFAGSGELVGFAWTSMVDGQPGIGLIDLTTGGWSKGPYLEDDTYTGANVTSLVRLVDQDSPAWMAVLDTGSDHLEIQSTTAAYQTVGQIDLSISDLRSGLTKVFDEIALQFDPLPADVSVSVWYSTDNGNSYTSAGSSVSQEGQTSARFSLGVNSRSLGVRVVMTSTGAGTPVLGVVQLKLHATASADRVIVIPVNCSDQLAGLNGQTLPNELTGIQRYKQLEALVGSRILFQDVDWPTTQSSSVWELIGCESQLYGVRSAKKNRRVDSGRAILTLRKAS